MKQSSHAEGAAAGKSQAPTQQSCTDSASADVRALTPAELEAMRREFAASAAWMDEMIRSGKLDEL